MLGVSAGPGPRVPPPNQPREGGEPTGRLSLVSPPPEHSQPPLADSSQPSAPQTRELSVDMTGSPAWSPCAVTVCLKPQQQHRVALAGRGGVQPQGNFSCALTEEIWCFLKGKSLQILILQEGCGASVISHFWQAYVNSIQGGRTSSEQRNPSSLPLV